ncbi:nicotinic acetylcholine receptor alpha 1 subunit [Sarcoptes scabiei]|nr:nicotinic acetylcholine receptor alpha 1 subunit [Sarcoptes scabiei]
MSSLTDFADRYVSGSNDRTRHHNDRSRDRSRSRESRRSRVRHRTAGDDTRRRSRSRSRSRDRFPSRGSKSKRYSESDNEFSTKGQGPPRIEGMISLKVDNITHRTTVSQLKRLFSRYGELGDIYVPRYPDSYMTRGFAFVRYFRKRDAEEAMRKLDGERLDGRVLSIQMAKFARPDSRRKRDFRSRRRSRSLDR